MPVVQIGGANLPDLLLPSSQVAIDSRNQFFVAPTARRGSVSVFDSSGSFLRSFGRNGRGPGEIGDVFRIVVIPGDTLLIADSGNGRIHFFTVAGVFVRSVPLTMSPYSIVVAGDHLLVSGESNSADSFGHPFHMVDRRTGEFVSFGGQPGPSLRVSPLHLERPLVAASRDEVWTVTRLTYVIERWNLASKSVGTRMTRRPPWFTYDSLAERRYLPWIERPRSTLGALAVDVVGRLWTLSTSAAENWKAQPGGTPGRIPPAAEYDKYVDRIVEVIDPQQRAVLATMRLSSSVVGFLPSGRMYSRVSDENGVVSISVVKLSLVR
jgi:DNA-binding beta-propeller fold protein YncE